MSSEWHYAKGGSRLGPVASQRLKELAIAGELVPTDLIWKEGMAEWRPASTLKGLFPESQPKPAGPPPLPPAKPEEKPSPPLPSAELDAQSVVPSPTAKPTNSSPARKPDIFDKARELAQKAKAKAEAFQKEAQARAERMQKESQANPNAAQAAITRGAKAAVDYARSDEAKELARKTRDTVKGGAIAASALVGAASTEGRERVRKAAEHPLGVGAALLCFFPLGLYLVWHHPHWTQRRKWAWTGAWLGVFFLMILPALVAGGRPGGQSAGDPTAVQKDSSNERSSGESLAVSGKTVRSRRHWSAPPVTDNKAHWLTDVQTLPPYVQQARGEGKGAWRLDRLSWGYPDKADDDNIVYLVEEKTGYTPIIVKRSLATVDGEMRERALIWTWFPNDPSFPWVVIADSDDKLELEVGLEVKLGDKVISGYRTKISPGQFPLDLSRSWDFG